jgi:phage replication initiation protein
MANGGGGGGGAGSSDRALAGVSALPADTMGVLTTSAVTFGSVIVDWIHGTFLDGDCERGLDKAKLLFGEITELEHGLRGYSHCGLILGGTGFVCWSPERPAMGVHVVLPSGALGELSRSWGDVREWLNALRSLGFRPGRLDLALDDRVGLLDFDVMRAAIVAEHYVSRFRNFEHDQGLRSADGHLKCMITCGVRSSGSYLRIYDKASEQKLPVGTHWIRCECEFKDKNAVAMYDRLLDEGPEAFLGVLRGLLEFKEPSEDSNVSRWPPASWWLRFLEEVGKLKIGLPSPVRSLGRVRDWLERSVAPSAALMMRAEGGAVEWLFDWLRQGDKRLKGYHLAMLPSVT